MDGRNIQEKKSDIWRKGYIDIGPSIYKFSIQDGRNVKRRQFASVEKEYMAGKSKKVRKQYKNIARGTTDPEIDSVTCIKFNNNMAPLALVENLTTRWRHLH